MKVTNVKNINRTNKIVNSFNRIKRFFIKNYIYIISLVLLFIGGTVVFRMHGVNFNPNTSSHIDKIVTIESFSGGGEFINSVDEDETVGEKDKENNSEEPENTEPENTEPENTEPENTEPENTEPENTEPENTEPDEESNRKDDKEMEEANRREKNKSRHERYNRIGRDFGARNSSKGLCKKKPHEIHDVCTTLSKDRCIKTECCIYAHHQNADGDDSYECIHGDESGSNYKTKDGAPRDIDHWYGAPRDIDHWYYMTKCYGTNCDGKSTQGARETDARETDARETDARETDTRETDTRETDARETDARENLPKE
uniref:Uncharacterized protein n=1 Tax=viral metagenome TaxID=1070528 RepID=A0A6C0C044_9ZZZZ